MVTKPCAEKRRGRGIDDDFLTSKSLHLLGLLLFFERKEIHFMLTFSLAQKDGSFYALCDLCNVCVRGGCFVCCSNIDDEDEMLYGESDSSAFTSSFSASATNKDAPQLQPG
jgi:hypothetical protein